MRLHHKLLKQSPALSRGFTLVELLVALAAGSLVALAASELMLGNLRSSASLEATQRLRGDWNRTSHFIESEVALSERVITSSTSLNLEQCSPTISNTEFVFGLEIRRDLPPAIYFVRNNETNSLEWNGDKSLWRCGPSIDINGEYTNIISGTTSSQLSAERLVDGMTDDCKLSQENQTTTAKSLRYELCLRGMTNYRYVQRVNTYSRVSPVFSYPNTTTLCSDDYLTIEGFYKLEGGTAGPNLLDLPSTGLSNYDAILICGYGGGDTIIGSTANDVLEAGDSGATDEPGATMIGDAGSDRLLGGPGDDILEGGAGDDVLIGGAGNDDLDGGEGENQFLPGTGNNTITGGPGLDVLFLNVNKADPTTTGLSDCKRSKCDLEYTENESESSANTSDIEVIIFRDGRHDITQ